MPQSPKVLPLTVPAANSPGQQAALTGSGWLNGGWGAAALAVAVYCLVFAIYTLARWGGESYQALISDVASLPVSLFAAAACFRISWRTATDRATRRAWAFIGLALLASFAGDLLWFNYEIVQQTAPFPSWADAAYLLFYPLMILGLLSLPYSPITRSERQRLLLNTAVVLVGGWMVIWNFVLAPSVSGFTTSLESLIVAAYPIGDLTIIAGLAYFLFRNPAASRRSGFSFLLFAMLLFVAGDLLYAVQGLEGVYISGGPLDNSWLFSYLTFALAALGQSASLEAHGPGFAAAKQRRYVWLVPYVMLALGGALVIWDYAQPPVGSTSTGLLVGLVTLMALVSIQQILEVQENRRLSAELGLRLKQLEETGEALSRAQHLAGIGTLAAGVAHEINNPLSVIITNSESLGRRLERDSLEPQTIRTSLERIERAAWHGARIARSLLTYAHGNELSLSRASAAELTAEALTLAGLPIGGQADIQVTIESDAPQINCDRGQIAQVLVNLLHNARQAAGPAGAVSLAAFRDGGGGLALKVTDNGPGMEPDVLARAFDPFFSTKAMGEGTGLGLSISRGIVRAHDGEIEIESAPGRGTQVTVRLPLEPRARPAEA